VTRPRSAYATYSSISSPRNANRVSLDALVVLTGTYHLPTRQM